MSTGTCRRVTLTGTVAVGLLREQAFAMFTPSGERTWAEGGPHLWFRAKMKPRPVPFFGHSTAAGETNWTYTHCEPGHSIKYVLMTPGERCGLVTVSCESSYGGTDVTVGYDLTSLGTGANDSLERFARNYAAFLNHWERYHRRGCKGWVFIRSSFGFMTRRRGSGVRGVTGFVGALVVLGILGVLASSTIAAEAKVPVLTGAYQLYCPDPVETPIVMHVRATARVSPSGPAMGHRFFVSGFQTEVTFPSALASALAKMSPITGKVTGTVLLFGASPHRRAVAESFVATIPASVPGTGFNLEVPSRGANLGIFKATSKAIRVEEASQFRLSLTVGKGRIAPNSCAGLHGLFQHDAGFRAISALGRHERTAIARRHHSRHRPRTLSTRHLRRSSTGRVGVLDPPETWEMPISPCGSERADGALVANFRRPGLEVLVLWRERSDATPAASSATLRSPHWIYCDGPTRYTAGIGHIEREVVGSHL